MRKCCIPRKIVNFLHHMLWEQVTTIKFDNYMSEPIDIDNGIGQGDPLSIVMYQYYNVDLLNIPSEENESAIAYVDDTVMLATTSTFQEAHDKLLNIMTKEGGVAKWSTTHNSPLEYSKLALVDFAHSSSSKERTPLCLLQLEIQPMESTRYLGGIFNKNLDWTAQRA